MTNQAATLQIAICTYNGAERLADTLDTVAALTDPHALSATIVIDNASTDATADVARAHPLGVRVVHEPTPGLAHARATAIAAATAPLIAFVDDDVLLDPDWASAVLRVAQEHPRAGMIGGPVELLFESGPTRIARRYATKLAQQDRGPVARDIPAPEDALIGAAVVLRRDALDAAGWPWTPLLTDRSGTALTSGGDLEIGVRIRNAGYTIRYEPAARAQHRIPAARQTRDYLARLSRGIGQGEPFIRWLDAGAPTDAPGRAWLAPKLERAERKHRKTRLLEWRPGRRAIRLAERTGRLEGYRLLAQMIDTNDAPRPDAGEARLSEAPPA